MRFSLSEAFLSFPRSMGTSNFSLNLRDFNFYLITITTRTLTKLKMSHGNDYYHLLSPSNSGQQKLNKAHSSCWEVLRMKTIKQGSVI